MSWGHSCSIGPDVEEARFLSPMQPYKVTLSVLSRAPPSGGLLTTAASSKLCGPTRTAGSQLMHGFNTCHAGRDVGQLLVCAWVAQEEEVLEDRRHARPGMCNCPPFHRLFCAGQLMYKHDSREETPPTEGTQVLQGCGFVRVSGFLEFRV